MLCRTLALLCVGAVLVTIASGLVTSCSVPRQYCPAGTYQRNGICLSTGCGTSYYAYDERPCDCDTNGENCGSCHICLPTNCDQNADGTDGSDCSWCLQCQAGYELYSNLTQLHSQPCVVSTDPIITCPANITLVPGPGVVSLPYNYVSTATDNTGVPLSPVCTPPSGSTFFITNFTNPTVVKCVATDPGGSSSTCKFSVWLRDNVGPYRITCPTDYTINATNGVPRMPSFWNYGFGDAQGIKAQYCNYQQGYEFGLGRTGVSCWGIDFADRSASCYFVITVSDTTVPQITCPATINVSPTAGVSYAVVAYNPLTYDNGGVRGVSCGPSSGQRFYLGQTNVTCTVTDWVWLTASCKFMINVTDFVPPTITCPVSRTFNTSGNLPSAAVTLTTPTATDASGIRNNTCDVVSGRFPVGVTPINCTAVDNAGNSASCQYSITVIDFAPPVVTCSANITTPTTGNAPMSAATFTSTASDASGIIKQGCNATSGTLFPFGITYVVCIAIDAVNKSSQCLFQINVIDASVPKITCPPSLNISTSEGTEFANVSLGVTSSDASGIASLTCTPASGSLFPLNGPNRNAANGRTYTPVSCLTYDNIGKSASCSFFTYIYDAQNPVISCPPSINVPPLTPSGSVVNFTTNATDNSGIQSLICNVTSGATFPQGTTTVGCTAKDNANKTASCTFSVTVSLATPPIMTCPGSMVLTPTQGSPFASAEYAALATESSGIASNVCSPPSGSTFALGTNTTIVCTAFSVAGASSTCSFTVTVVDKIAPVLTCPALDTVVNPDPAVLYANINYSPAPSATDGSGIQNLTCTPPSGSQFNTATTSVIQCSAVDNANNSVGCSFKVVVRDVVPPTITCPSDIVTSPIGTSLSAAVNYPLPIAADNAGIKSIVCNQTTGSVFNQGTTGVLCTATDTSDLKATCTFQVSVRDVTPPSITCSMNITAYTSKDASTGIANWLAPVASDNSGPVTVSCDPPIGTSVFSAGVRIVNCTAVDLTNNQASCSFSITVLDNQNPDVSCPVSYADTLTLGTNTKVQNYVFQASDNVALNFTYCDPPTGSVFLYGETTVVCTAVDRANRSSSCSFIVTINDRESPVVKCPAAYLGATSPGEDTGNVTWAPPSVGANTASDNVGIIAMTCSVPFSTVTFPLGQSPISCYATDDAGNVGSCQFVIDVSDKEPPTVTCPPDEYVNISVPLTKATIGFALDLPDDNVGVVSRTLQRNGVDLDIEADNSEFPLGRTVMTYSVADAAGNSRSCSWAVVVVQAGVPPDTEPPTVNCPATTNFVFNTDFGKASAVVNWPSITYTDKVGVVAATYITSPPGYAQGSRFPVGRTRVQFIASDAQGNFASCDFNVTVQDREIPRVSCPSNFELWANPPLNKANVTWQAPSFSDNVALISTSLSRVPGEYEAGSYSVTASATDPSNNEGTCSFTFTVLTDTIPPTVVCPTSQTVNTTRDRADAAVSWPSPVVTDNRGIASTTYTPRPYLPGSVFPLGSTDMNFTVKDIYNNIQVCQFRIIVHDTQKPVVSCPASFNVTLERGQNVSIVRWPAPTAYDNVQLSVFSVSAEPGNPLEAGDYLITTFANDTSGNVANECNFRVVVFEPPAEPKPSDSAATTNTAATGAGAGIAGILALIAMLAFVSYLRQKRRQRELEEQYGSFEMTDEAILARAQAIQQALQNKKRNETPSMKWLQVTPAQFKSPPKTIEEMDKYLSVTMGKELRREDVVIESEIGAGEFGSVCNGYLKRQGNGKLTIAIKTLKDSGDETQKIKFLQEATIMAQFKHPKIVQLVGVVTKGEPVLICLEFMELGSLRSYLKSELVVDKLSDADLIRMACDVCSGMHYLSESGFVHRDLAARNVLINRDFICKVCDFGLSQELGDDPAAAKDEKIPIRWTAPEAVLQHQFSALSDVWSFGILLWEMWSYGAMPYKGWNNEVVMSNVTKGYRMPTPKNCPQYMYSLMLETWCDDPMERPEFYGVFERLLAAWHFAQPVSKTYDTNGRRISKQEEFTEEEGDVYDLGGEEGGQTKAKKRVLVVTGDQADEDEEEVEYSAAEQAAPVRAQPQVSPVDDDDDEDAAYDLGGNVGAYDQDDVPAKPATATAATPAPGQQQPNTAAAAANAAPSGPAPYKPVPTSNFAAKPSVAGVSKPAGGVASPPPVQLNVAQAVRPGVKVSGLVQVAAKPGSQQQQAPAPAHRVVVKSMQAVAEAEFLAGSASPVYEADVTGFEEDVVMLDTVVVPLPKPAQTNKQQEDDDGGYLALAAD